ncbi:hypothetical protein HY087_00800 [Candidatus Gottesmanbacteria bacterium]|nr:hypothetical protein [Candidatus Gottesmanbacteria bacterium]
MSAWLIIFGRTHELSYHELVVHIALPVTRITPDVSRIDDFQDEVVPEQLIERLGGTVKIACVKGSIPSLDALMLASFLKDDTELHTFGISVYGLASAMDSEMPRRVKEILAEQGVHARYVLPHEGSTLSSVVVTKQHVRELIVVAAEDGFVVGVTVAVQGFEAWNQRDYGRPFADPKAGMLPPKVARMVVNIAEQSKVQSPKSKVLLDPFCGMGTILGEALLTGWNVIGSDQSVESVGKARKNLEWLAKLTGRDPVMNLFVSDATHVSEHIPQASVDAIVTEPFMGNTAISEKQEARSISLDTIRNVTKGLEKLYIGCLRDWRGVLKPAGKIVIALPQYAIHAKTFFVKNVIDRCENLGYTVTLGPLTYSRPQAIVRRQFYIFQKK